MEETTLMLIERLQAVETIIGGTSVPSREELDCAAEELEEIIKSMDHFGYVKDNKTGRWFQQFNYLVPEKGSPTDG